ncbi:MAG: permease [Gammaproteobacteria bacterium]|nr:permease [Gammaproteobacteria bacterium]
MSSCHEPPKKEESHGCCGVPAAPEAPWWRHFDWLLWVSFVGVAIAFVGFYLDFHVGAPAWLNTLITSTVELMNTMWIGIALGVIALALLSQVPRELVMSALGTNKGKQGILRATMAGLLLDLCNHGILMVGAKLYERGASIGQVMAFLIASPWNSLSLTFIMIALMGWTWTLAFIGLSLVIAIIAGYAFDALVARGTLPKNPYQITDIDPNFSFWKQASASWSNTTIDRELIKTMLVSGIKDSRMVLRWMLFGVLLASAIRAWVPTEVFSTYFGPTMIGLFLTVVAATIIEVCSEGSTPIAADLLNRAGAPGNSFAFLMTGVSTDYTEIMVIRDVTKSWKIALFLPLLTVPQVLIIAWVLNVFV